MCSFANASKSFQSILECVHKPILVRVSLIVWYTFGCETEIKFKIRRNAREMKRKKQPKRENETTMRATARESMELGRNKNNSIEFSRSIFKLIMEILFVVALKRAPLYQEESLSQRHRNERENADMDSCVRTSVATTTLARTNTSTHCKLIQNSCRFIQFIVLLLK